MRLTQITFQLRRSILDRNIKNAQAKASLVESCEQTYKWYESPQRCILPKLGNLKHSPMADRPERVQGAAYTLVCTLRQQCAGQPSIFLPAIQCHSVVLFSSPPWRSTFPVCHSKANLRHVEALHGPPQIIFWKLAVNTIDHNLRNVSQSPRDFFNLIGLARLPEEADLSSTLEDAPVTKLLFPRDA